MKLQFIFVSFVFVVLHYANGDRVVDSTIMLIDKSDKEISYGVVISRTSIILPKIAYERFENGTKFEYFNEFFKNRGLKSLSETQTTPKRYPLPAGSFRKLNENAYIFESNDLIECTFEKKTLKMRRYSVCEDDGNLKVVTPGIADFEHTTIELPSDYLCKIWYPNLDEKTQVCSALKLLPYLEPIGMPLIATINAIDYVVGNIQKTSNLNIALYNVLGEKCYKFPIYSKCDYISSLSEYTFCNAMEVSRDLSNSGHPEIILTQNLQNPQKFGFAMVVDDDQLIVIDDDTAEFHNFVMFKNGGIFKKLRDTHFFVVSDPTYVNGKVFALIKFNSSLFQDFPKPIFYFDESFNGTTENKDYEMFQFINEQISIQKVEDGSLNAFPFPHFVFYDGKIIGFQDGNEFFSVSLFKDFLQSYTSTLRFELPSTSTTEITVASKTESTTVVTTPKNPAKSNFHGFFVNSFWVLTFTLFLLI